MLQATDRIMPEIIPELADYGARVLGKRIGAEIRTNTFVQSIEPGKVHLPAETIEADTIILTAGILPSPVVAGLPVDKDKHGHIVVDGTMRCPSRPEVWALGDCASVPAPDGKPYPEPGPACLARGQGSGPQHHGCVRMASRRSPSFMARWG